MMEELGFFEHIYEHLPEGFTALFEIARVIEDKSHQLTQKLLPALKLQAAAIAPDAAPQQESETFIPAGEEYEARHIRNMTDITRIYTYQHILPEEIFLRKVADRTLWVPYAKEPTYRSFPSHENAYDPDARKQKVYLLLDTSSSMGLKNRIHLAKAIVYYFLKKNMLELGSISLRTFDTKIGELHVADDRESFHALISYAMRLHTLGNGTAMAKAISQAVKDIRESPQGTGTEILIVTDGACLLDEAEMRMSLGDTIKIHTVKIGKTQLFASRSFIDDALEKESSPKHRALKNLRKNEGELLRELQHASSPSLRHKCESSLEYIGKEISILYAELTEEYGNELQRLSTVYVNVDDVPGGGIYRMDEERMNELRALFHQIENELLGDFSLEHLKKATLLSDHISMLLQFVKEESLKNQLGELDKKIEQLLQSTLQQQVQAMDSSLMSSFSAEDRHDIQFLLERSIQTNMSLWKLMLWKMISRIRRALHLRIQKQG